MGVFDGGSSVATIAPEAETRWSGPISFCNSPIASISASLALARASDWADACELLRSEIAERLNNPTAMMVRRIISESVTTKANPGISGLWDVGFFMSSAESDEVICEYFVIQKNLTTLFF